MKIEIIYEDKNIIAVSKPAGLLVHSTTPEREEIEKTLVGWLLFRHPKIIKVGDSGNRPGIVHRLDRDTSGVILVAKNQDTFDHLKDQFQERLTNKTYRAIVYGNPKNKGGVIEGTISLKPGTTKRTVHKGKMAKEAVTEYRVLERFKEASYIEVYPKTGRTHQIRVHMASINHPILGDKLYASKTSKKLEIPGLERQMLHAYSIEFETLEGKKIEVKADIPADFDEVLNYLRNTAKLHTQ